MLFEHFVLQSSDSPAPREGPTRIFPYAKYFNTSDVSLGNAVLLSASTVMAGSRQPIES